MASRWLPNVEEFFDSLYQCICDCQHQLQSGESGDHHYWFRRLRNFQRSVDTMITRYRSNNGAGAPSRLLENLTTLQQYITSLCSQLAAISSQRLLNESTMQGESIATATYLAGTTGRPRLSINMENVRSFRLLGFSWRDIR